MVIPAYSLGISAAFVQNENNNSYIQPEVSQITHSYTSELINNKFVNYDKKSYVNDYYNLTSAYEDINLKIVNITSLKVEYGDKLVGINRKLDINRGHLDGFDWSMESDEEHQKLKARYDNDVALSNSIQKQINTLENEKIRLLNLSKSLKASHKKVEAKKALTNYNKHEIVNKSFSNNLLDNNSKFDSCVFDKSIEELDHVVFENSSIKSDNGSLEKVFCSDFDVVVEDSDKTSSSDRNVGQNGFGIIGSSSWDVTAEEVDFNTESEEELEKLRVNAIKELNLDPEDLVKSKKSMYQLTPGDIVQLCGYQGRETKYGYFTRSYYIFKQYLQDGNTFVFDLVDQETGTSFKLSEDDFKSYFSRWDGLVDGYKGYVPFRGYVISSAIEPVEGEDPVEFSKKIVSTIVDVENQEIRKINGYEKDKDYANKTLKTVGICVSVAGAIMTAIGLTVNPTTRGFFVNKFKNIFPSCFRLKDTRLLATPILQGGAHQMEVEEQVVADEVCCAISGTTAKAVTYSLALVGFLVTVISIILTTVYFPKLAADADAKANELKAKYFAKIQNQLVNNGYKKI